MRCWREFCAGFWAAYDEHSGRATWRRVREAEARCLATLHRAPARREVRLRLVRRSTVRPTIH